MRLYLDLFKAKDGGDDGDDEEKKPSTPPEGPKPPDGYEPIPNSKRGGYRKRVGDSYVYWYPEDGDKAGLRTEPHDDDRDIVAAAEPEKPAPGEVPTATPKEGYSSSEPDQHKDFDAFDHYEAARKLREEGSHKLADQHEKAAFDKVKDQGDEEHAAVADLLREEGYFEAADKHEAALKEHKLQQRMATSADGDRQLAERQQQHEEQLSQLEQEKKEALAGVKEKQDKALEKIQADHDKAVKAAEESAQKEQARVEKDYKDGIASSEEKYENRLTALQNAHDAEVDAAQQKHKTTLETAKADRDSAIKDAQASHDKLVGAARAKLDESVRVVAETHKEYVDQLKADQKRERDALNARKRRATRKAAKQRDADIEAGRSEARAHAAYAKTVKRLEAEYQPQLDESKAKLKTDIEAADKGKEQLLEAAKDEFTDVSEKAKQKLKKKTDAADSSLAEKKVAADRILERKKKSEETKLSHGTKAADAIFDKAQKKLKKEKRAASEKVMERLASRKRKAGAAQDSAVDSLSSSENKANAKVEKEFAEKTQKTTKLYVKDTRNKDGTPSTQGKKPSTAAERVAVHDHSERADRVADAINAHLQNPELPKEVRGKLQDIATALEAHSKNDTVPTPAMKRELNMLERAAGAYSRQPAGEVDDDYSFTPSTDLEVADLAAHVRDANELNDAISSHLKDPDITENDKELLTKLQNALRAHVNRKDIVEKYDRIELSSFKRAAGKFSKPHPDSVRGKGPKTSLDHAQLAQHKQQAKAAIENIQAHIDSGDLDPGEKEKLMLAVRSLQQHTNMKRLPTKEQQKQLRSALSVAGAQGKKPPKDILDEKGDKSAGSGRRPASQSAGKMLAQILSSRRGGGSFGRMLARADKNPLAAIGYAVTGAIGAGHKLLARKSMDGIYIDLSKAQETSTAMATPVGKKARKIREENYESRAPAGVSGSAALPDDPEVGKRWPDAEDDEETEKNLHAFKAVIDVVKKTVEEDGLDKCEKSFLLSQGYSLGDIYSGKATISGMAIQRFNDYVFSDFEKSLETLGGALDEK